MIANYHTHTFRSHHASGTEEEYVQRAIDSGFRILGFSDHAPFMFPDGYQSSYRVDMEDAENYISAINNLKEKYKDKIKIFVGFEMEYYPMYFEDMLENVKTLGAEYLILGQHFINNEYPNGKYVLLEKNSEEDLKEYVDCVIKGIRSGKFSYIAHPDVFNFDSESEIYQKEMRRLCVAAKSFDIPLEINFLGIMDNRIYPTENFFRIAGEVENKVIFGSDAHSAEAVFDKNTLDKAERLVEKYGLHRVDTIKLLKL